MYPFIHPTSLLHRFPEFLQSPDLFDAPLLYLISKSNYFVLQPLGTMNKYVFTTECHFTQFQCKSK